MTTDPVSAETPGVEEALATMHRVLVGAHPPSEWAEAMAALFRMESALSEANAKGRVLDTICKEFGQGDQNIVVTLRQSRAALSEAREALKQADAWCHDATSALRAAKTIGEREGCHLNYPNLDRLIAASPFHTPPSERTT